MSLPEIFTLLANRIGLDPESIGIESLSEVVRVEMAKLSLDDHKAYFAAIKNSRETFFHLVEALLVPETWFFRGREAFELLGKIAREEWLTEPRKKTWPEKLWKRKRILSAPCATGEEPFSIAIALLESGIPGTDFQIDAIDLSSNFLREARKGVFGKPSFRGTEFPPNGLLFEPAGNGVTKDPTGAPKFKVKQSVLDCVRFDSGNLADPAFLLGEAPYDIIFCRNLLIYLHADARKTLIKSLTRLLSPDGYLFTGYAELPFFQASGFTSVKAAKCFACRKTAPQPAASLPPPPPPPPAAFRRPRTTSRMAALSARLRRSAIIKSSGATGKSGDFAGSHGSHGSAGSGGPAPKSATTGIRSVVSKSGVSRASEPDETRLSPIELARRLADRGELNEALTICRKSLRDQDTSSELFSLMGLIHQALDQFDRAEEYFNRALFMDPRLSEPLMNLSLIYEKKGDTAKAEVFRARARRAATSENKD